MKLIRVVVLVGIVAIVGPSCDNATGPNGPGTFTLTLSTPNTDDGAILLSMPSGVDSVTALPGSTYEVLWSAATRKVIVRGSISAGPLAKVWVANVGADASAAVLQVAARATYGQRGIGGYAITVLR